MPYTGAMVRFAFANVAVSQTDSVIVAATTGHRVRVVGLYVLTGDTGTDVTLNSKGAGAGTAITGLMALGNNGGLVLPPADYGWMQTNVGEALTATTGAGSATAIHVAYVLDPD